MKSLKLYLEQIFTTPMNTCGMGNLSLPNDNGIGSGDIIIYNKEHNIKKHKKKYEKFKQFSKRTIGNECTNSSSRH